MRVRSSVGAMPITLTRRIRIRVKLRPFPGPVRPTVHPKNASSLSMSSPSLPLHPLAAAALSTSGRGVAPARLPPLGASADGLGAAQRRALIAGIVAAHVAGVWALMQVSAVQEAVRETVPMFVQLIAPEVPTPPPAPVPPAPPPPLPPPPPPPEPAPKPLPIRKPPPPRPVAKVKPRPVVQAAPRPAPAEFVVPAPPPAPLPPAPPPPVPVAAAPVALPPAPSPPPAPPPPKDIPPSAVQYLVAPVLEYPRLARRNGESGRVLVRVYIDTAGRPRTVQVSASSGHTRLDDAAIEAVRGARFKPYTENGQAIAGWALIPLIFELER